MKVVKNPLASNLKRGNPNKVLVSIRQKPSIFKNTVNVKVREGSVKVSVKGFVWLVKCCLILAPKLDQDWNSHESMIIAESCLIFHWRTSSKKVWGRLWWRASPLKVYLYLYKTCDYSWDVLNFPKCIIPKAVYKRMTIVETASMFCVSSIFIAERRHLWSAIVCPSK